MQLNNTTRHQLQAIQDAASPEAFASAVSNLLAALADEAFQAAHECETAWQDASAGKPWKVLGRKIGKMGGKL